MSSMEPANSGGAGALTPQGSATAATTRPEGGATNLADVLERVLDKGVVIAGDIQVNLLDIELLTIKLRLIVASVDTARRMGIRWWEDDPALAGGDRSDDHRSLRERVKRLERQLERGSDSDRALPADDLEDENRALREEVERLERRLERTAKSDEAGND
jgi:Gas vesicle protein